MYYFRSTETEPVEECCPCEDEVDHHGGDGHHGGSGYGYKPSYGGGYGDPQPQYKSGYGQGYQAQYGGGKILFFELILFHDFT